MHANLRTPPLQNEQFGPGWRGQLRSRAEYHQIAAAMVPNVRHSTNLEVRKSVLACGEKLLVKTCQANNLHFNPLLSAHTPC